MLDNHDRANNFVLASITVRAGDIPFEGRLQLPAKLPWSQLTLRAYAHTPRQEGLGIELLRKEVRSQKSEVRGRRSEVGGQTP
jgi:hypothetical protein